jgi:hypothetical protein
MLEEKLIYFYNSGLSYWHLAIKHFWKRIFTLVISNVVFIWLFKPIDISTSLLISIINFTLFIMFIMKPVWGCTRKHYNAVYPDPDWFIFLCATLKRFLKKELNDELSKEALDFLISRLTKRLESKSKNSFLGIVSNSITLIVSFLIPVWSAFNTWHFKDVNKFSDLYLYIIIILLCAFIIFPSLKYLISRFRRFFFDDISEVDKLSGLIEKLEIIRFSIENTRYFKEIDQYLDKNSIVVDHIIKEFDLRYEYYTPDPIVRIYKYISVKIIEAKTNKKFNKRRK